MDWERDLADWPNSDLSRRIRVQPHDWHVQEQNIDAGNTVLLLHGAGASTHTWRDILPVLAYNRHVVAIDMPGQGFTKAGTLRRCSLEMMSKDVARLVAAQNWSPTLIIGHSAGAALALQLAKGWATDGGPRPEIIGINAALDSFEGIARWLFPTLAKALALNPLTSLMFTAGGNAQGRAKRLIEGTGSTIDDIGLQCYGRLFGNRRHVDATLQMMAQWNVDNLIEQSKDIPNRCFLLAAENDRAVPQHVSERAASVLQNASYTPVSKHGHLFHEEDPNAFLMLLSELKTG